MSRKQYPIIDRVVDRRKAWTYTDKRGRIKSHATRPVCAACGAPATHLVDIQVNWFRGDDEQRKACELHRNDADALLKIHPDLDMAEEVQLLMDRDMGDS